MVLFDQIDKILRNDNTKGPCLILCETSITKSLLMLYMKYRKCAVIAHCTALIIHQCAKFNSMGEIDINSLDENILLLSELLIKCEKVNPILDFTYINNLDGSCENNSEAKEIRNEPSKDSNQLTNLVNAYIKIINNIQDQDINEIYKKEIIIYDYLNNEITFFQHLLELKPMNFIITFPSLLAFRNIEKYLSNSTISLSNRKSVKLSEYSRPNIDQDHDGEDKIKGRINFYTIGQKLINLVLFKDSYNSQCFLQQLEDEIEAWKRMSVIYKKFKTKINTNMLNKMKTVEIFTYDEVIANKKMGNYAPDKTIIIDSREFSSSYPYEMFLAGVNMVPMMIRVGDYILSR